MAELTPADYEKRQFISPMEMHRDIPMSERLKTIPNVIKNMPGRISDVAKPTSQTLAPASQPSYYQVETVSSSSGMVLPKINWPILAIAAAGIFLISNPKLISKAIRELK